MDNKVIYGGASFTGVDTESEADLVQAVSRTCDPQPSACVVLNLYSYRNMCRFNSGVSLAIVYIYTPSWTHVATVLLQARVTGEVQVLLACRVSDIILCEVSRLTVPQAQHHLLLRHRI
jgi:hypothetical protein